MVILNYSIRSEQEFVGKPLEDCFITFDVDWAPDWICFELSNILEEYGVPSTWFVTHPSKHVEYMLSRPNMYEVGIHPNLLETSSHGRTLKEVFEYFTEFVPNARIMRTHGVYQTGSLLEYVAIHTAIEIDSSILLRGCSGIKSCSLDFNGHRLCRLPFVWADDHEINAGEGLWSTNDIVFNYGLKVFAFHPVHVALNSRHPDQYRLLRSRVGQDIAKATKSDVLAEAHSGFGTLSFFKELLTMKQGACFTRDEEYKGLQNASNSFMGV